MRVFKNKSFDRFARRAGLEDLQLCDAVADIEAGRIDADLGQGVFKQRIARKGSGKSGGLRTIVVLKVDAVAFFVYGYAKNDVANLTLGELHKLKKLAEHLLALGQLEVAEQVSDGILIEVICR